MRQARLETNIRQIEARNQAISTAAIWRKFVMSRSGESPNKRLYSRLNIGQCYCLNYEVQFLCYYYPSSAVVFVAFLDKRTPGP